MDTHVFKRKTEVWAAEPVTKDAVVSSAKESLHEALPHDAFVDPVADHMEAFLNSRFVTCFLYEDQVYQHWPLYGAILIMGAHDRRLFLISPTVAQTTHFFLQVLKWLHWLFHFT